MDIKYDLHIYLTEKWSKPHYILPSHTECNLPSNPIACIFSHCKIIEPLIFVHMNYILVECFIKEYQSRVKLSLFCCCRKAFSSLNKIRHRRSLFSREHKREAWSYQGASSPLCTLWHPEMVAFKLSKAKWIMIMASVVPLLLLNLHDTSWAFGPEQH